MEHSNSVTATGDSWNGGGDQPLRASYGKMMMWFFIVSDALTFSAFIAAYGFSRYKFIETWPIADEVFTHVPFFRSVENFLVQFGIDTDQRSTTFENARIQDDPPLDPPIPFTDGIISFAGFGKDSRTTHLFFTRGHQPHLGKDPWEVPIGNVCVDSLDAMHSIYSGYADQLDQQKLHGDRASVNAYLTRYPKMDWIHTCGVVEEPLLSPCKASVESDHRASY